MVELTFQHRYGIPRNTGKAIPTAGSRLYVSAHLTPVERLATIEAVSPPPSTVANGNIFHMRTRTTVTKRPTRNDVARRANVSGWTVSHVLNGDHSVSISEET